MTSRILLIGIVGIVVGATTMYFAVQPYGKEIVTGNVARQDTLSREEVIDEQWKAITQHVRFLSEAKVANTADDLPLTQKQMPTTLPPSKPTSMLPANTPPAAVATSSGITAVEVSKHADAKSCWIIVGNDVYDVTSFIPNHPGGPARILKLCGTDATAMFSEQHSGDSRPQKMLTSLKIGRLSK